MPEHNTSFPLRGDNFETIAYTENDIELACMLLGLVFPDSDDKPCDMEILEADYQVALAAFQWDLERTGTVIESDEEVG